MDDYHYSMTTTNINGHRHHDYLSQLDCLRAACRCSQTTFDNSTANCMNPKQTLTKSGSYEVVCNDKAV